MASLNPDTACLAGQPEQNDTGYGLRGRPTYITAVYADSSTQMLNSSTMNLGGLFRVYGLVFNGIGAGDAEGPTENPAAGEPEMDGTEFTKLVGSSTRGATAVRFRVERIECDPNIVQRAASANATPVREAGIVLIWCGFSGVREGRFAW